MGARFRLVRLLPWVLGLVLLPFVLGVLPGRLPRWDTRLLTTTSDVTGPALIGPSRTAEAQPTPAVAQPIASRKERPVSDDEQRRLLMYLILRGATGRYPFAVLR